MSVKRVTASLTSDAGNLNNVADDLYSGELRAPKQSGEYGITVTAEDDSGNVTVLDYSMDTRLILSAIIWQTPKVNWKPTDRFNWWDYNRIKNNLKYLHERAVLLIKPFQIEDMGEDITEYTAYWPVDVFNKFERNLETIDKNTYNTDYGEKQTFYENGVFIKWDELNRIENATLSINSMMDRQEVALSRLPFVLGRKREVKA